MRGHPGLPRKVFEPVVTVATLHPAAGCWRRASVPDVEAVGVDETSFLHAPSPKSDLVCHRDHRPDPPTGPSGSTSPTAARALSCPTGSPPATGLARTDGHRVAGSVPRLCHRPGHPAARRYPRAGPFHVVKLGLKCLDNVRCRSNRTPPARESKPTKPDIGASTRSRATTPSAQAARVRPPSMQQTSANQIR